MAMLVIACARPEAMPCYLLLVVETHKDWSDKDMNGNLYNIGPLGEIVMETWLDGPSPQCLVVKLPTMRRVGEDEFLLDLAKERYRRRGFRDAFGRHFISRRFALEGTSWDAEAFLGQAREVAEIFTMTCPFPLKA